MGVETICSGTRAGGQRPTKMPNGEGWGILLAVYDRRGEKASYHTILSRQITNKSKITWAGPLSCFPAETPRNKDAKGKLIEKYDASFFFAAIDNGEKGSHLAPVAITLSAEEGSQYPLYPCYGCPKFQQEDILKSKRLFK
jgi:hypothetical protein